MKTAVIDTGVFVAGVFWRHEPHLCLKAWLHGILLPVMSEEILAEYESVLERVKQEQHFTTETGSWLDTLRTSALWVTPVPFEEKVCRDPKDGHCARPGFDSAGKAIWHCHANPARLAGHIDPRSKTFAGLNQCYIPAL
jgi:putative PIN family toxin of toxin-antitoxin system